MTVSVVLNGSRSATRVSDATRLRIQEAAARLGYRPNAVARGLSRRRMDTLGVAAMIDGQVNLYFLEVLNGILAAAAEKGQTTTVFSVSDWAREESKLLQFCDGRVDGLIFIAATLTPAFGSALARRLPFVTIQGTEALPGIVNLDVDNEGGAYAMVRHMIAQGHRRIAHFTGDQQQSDARLRVAGYRRALTEAGIAWDDTLVLPGLYTIDSGRQNMAALLDRPGPPPTAVFCANDAMAYGSLEILAARGRRVPEDMSVGGFDDLMLAQMTTPHLTTIRQPFRTLGRRAVERLLWEIGAANGEGTEAPSSEAFSEASSETFAVELVVRGSIGPPAPAL